MKQGKVRQGVYLAAALALTAVTFDHFGSTKGVQAQDIRTPLPLAPGKLAPVSDLQSAASQTAAIVEGVRQGDPGTNTAKQDGPWTRVILSNVRAIVRRCAGDGRDPSFRRTAAEWKPDGGGRTARVRPRQGVRRVSAEHGLERVTGRRRPRVPRGEGRRRRGAGELGRPAGHPDRCGRLRLRADALRGVRKRRGRRPRPSRTICARSTASRSTASASRSPCGRPWTRRRCDRRFVLRRNPRGNSTGAVSCPFRRLTRSRLSVCPTAENPKRTFQKRFDSEDTAS